MTAVRRVHSRAQPLHQVHGHQVQPVTTDRAEESQRIARAIEQAQRAQDGFCWQTLGPTQCGSAERRRQSGGHPTSPAVKIASLFVASWGAAPADQLGHGTGAGEISNSSATEGQRNTAADPIISSV